MSLTKYETGLAVIASDVANSWYGGLYGSDEGASLSLGDPKISGHIHDGQHLDGHAQKINLKNHVTGQLDGSNIIDSSIPASKIIFEQSFCFFFQRVPNLSLILNLKLNSSSSLNLNQAYI